ncbi:MAG: tetratricopeptide repeat protein [Bacteroidota bacterium]
MTKPITLLLVFCIFLFTACQSDNSQSSALATLEQEVAEAATPEKTQQLIANYVETAATADAEQASGYLQKAAELHIKNNRFTDAALLLKQALREHYSSSLTPQHTAQLAQLYRDHLRSPESALTTVQAAAIAFKDNPAVSELVAALPKDLPALEARIDTLASRMYNDSLGRVNFRMANEYMNAGELYALILPTRPEAADYLAKAGETARSVRNFPKALTYYSMISEKYPDSDKAAQAMFLRAFTLDNDLKKSEEARPLYEAFLKKYPNDDFADDTRFLLENLGRTDDEIIESFSDKK